MHKLTMAEAREMVLADIRNSYGPEELTDDECIALARDTDERGMDPENQPLYCAYRMIMEAPDNG